MKARRLFPDSLVLTPLSRWPTTIPAESMHVVLGAAPAARIRQVSERPASPQVSFIIVARDGLFFTRLCLESLLAVPTAIRFEAIVVDNASTDGTREYLATVDALDARVRVVRNGWNAGFAAATNSGADRASGDVIVLLNNDTIVPPGFLERCVARTDLSDLGLVGAVTNRAGNEAQIDVSYSTYGGMRRFARRYTRAHAGELFDIRTATMFCTALRREVWREVGPLDDRFELGLFEDDDYAMRVRQHGYRVVCCDDLFVHHFGQATLGHLAPAGDYGRIFHANRARWEAKWGVVWQSYERRERTGYRDLVARVRALVSELVPDHATVAVISKGDGALLQLDGRRAWHFPEGERGMYAGHYPADSEACIDELERMRSKGAEFLVVPAPAQWWLDYYEQFSRHLHDSYRVLGAASTAATVFALDGR